MFTRAKASYEVVTLGGSVIATGESPRAAVVRDHERRGERIDLNDQATADDVAALLGEKLDDSEIPLATAMRAPETLD